MPFSGLDGAVAPPSVWIMRGRTELTRGEAASVRETAMYLIDRSGLRLVGKG